MASFCYTEEEEEVITDTSDGVPDVTDLSVPDIADLVPEVTEEAIPDYDSPYQPPDPLSRLDEFDSDKFLEAFRRYRIFEPLERDDLNEQDLDAEGDEEALLLDEIDHREGGWEYEDGESGEDDLEPLGDEPIGFDLDGADLSLLQIVEWDFDDEQHSGQPQLDVAPLYDGPCDPTSAAMAYAKNPLAIYIYIYAQRTVAPNCCRDKQVQTQQHRRNCSRYA
ncbi:hypothetical protein F444_03962 [Phytophthora nicotianae P1976]|uniref:PiggyBac transposable element-derived protein domain-containing protein n=1 Tax=Phytophthora nicotianae P1976 TaxID=1317066 RepID=A0A081ASE0_PHYNI|nr:hypothetical protein F444_03962 [Phytophthora nicotianae P1976]